MFGISYGELFLILGATAAVIGPKDLPKITRTAGRLAGRAIAYVQLARGHFDSVMQQSQATKVHKELQDTIAQLEAIRYEIRSISMVNPGPLARRFDQDQPNTNTTQVKLNEDEGLKMKIPKVDTMSSSLHSRAMAFAKLAESPSIRSPSNIAPTNITSTNKENENENNNGLVNVLPVSAESAGLLPKPTTDGIKGSDMFLEAILEAEVASNAKEFFSQHQNQIPEDLQGNGEEKKME